MAAHPGRHPGRDRTAAHRPGLPRPVRQLAADPGGHRPDRVDRRLSQVGDGFAGGDGGGSRGSGSAAGSGAAGRPRRAGRTKDRVAAPASCPGPPNSTRRVESVELTPHGCAALRAADPLELVLVLLVLEAVGREGDRPGRVVALGRVERVEQAVAAGDDGDRLVALPDPVAGEMELLVGSQKLDRHLLVEAREQALLHHQTGGEEGDHLAALDRRVADQHDLTAVAGQPEAHLELLALLVQVPLQARQGGDILDALEVVQGFVGSHRHLSRRTA